MNGLTLLKDALDALVKMPAEEAGALIQALIKDDDEPELPAYADLVYPLIRGQVKRIEEIREKRAEAGKKGADVRHGDGKAEANGKQMDSKTVAKDKQTDGKAEANAEQTLSPEPKPEPLKRKTPTGSKEKAAFVTPTVEEVEAYIREKGYHVDAVRFVSFYGSNGWKVGKNKMVNWHQALAGWEAREKVGHKPPEKPPDPRSIDYEATMREAFLQSYGEEAAR